MLLCQAKLLRVVSASGSPLTFSSPRDRDPNALKQYENALKTHALDSNSGVLYEAAVCHIVHAALEDGKGDVNVAKAALAHSFGIDDSTAPNSLQKHMLDTLQDASGSAVTST